MSKKDAILQVATKLFSEKGFKETRMSELSKMTGAAEGTIFYHFKNKEEIFLAILEHFKGDIVKEFQQYIAERNFGTGLEMMEGAISFYLHLASAMEDRFLLLHRHDAYELARVNPVCREQLETIYNCFLDIFEQAILLGQQDGSIAPMPARKTALILFSMVDGLVRFNTYDLYDAGALYNELIEACRRMLKTPQS
ncbi:MAG: TetR/AcrR family transcriptional regulator [Deltaproteobacteria bacterium]|nr:TetR/AcrR family transcriptional regulator [Deltaproteobacteria bacterium]MBW1793643.1 TetR/AcrR family transcriptional regulator [Deltaproteobacteria bacterium]MBW2330008.1 TetR/AcrR family transcriptional regulator [Deltaproteobacteria bacterium]